MMSLVKRCRRAPIASMEVLVAPSVLSIVTTFSFILIDCARVRCDLVHRDSVLDSLLLRP